jgi:hypothetical protein
MSPNADESTLDTPRQLPRLRLTRRRRLGDVDVDVDVLEIFAIFGWQTLPSNLEVDALDETDLLRSPSIK